MKNFITIPMIIALSLYFSTAMHIATKSDSNYYNTLDKRSDIDNDPRRSCPCSDNPMASCPCNTIKHERENIAESCSCPINDDHCSCILLQRRSHFETEEMDHNLDLFLQNLLNKVVDDIGQLVTLHLLRKEE